MELQDASCKRCHKIGSSINYNSLCSYCKCSDLFEKLSIEFREEIDKLVYSNSILQGIKIIIENLHISLGEGVELFHWRHDKLRELTPDKFKCSTKEYWKGFYS